MRYSLRALLSVLLLLGCSAALASSVVWARIWVAGVNGSDIDIFLGVHGYLE